MCLNKSSHCLFVVLINFLVHDKKNIEQLSCKAAARNDLDALMLRADTLTLD